MKKLELIIGDVDTIQVIGKVDFVIKDISKNSNDVDTNYLFVAIEGNEHDGHSYIQNAIDKGASSILCQKLPKSLVKNITYIKVKSSRKSYAKICCNFFETHQKS